MLQPRAFADGIVTAAYRRQGVTFVAVLEPQTRLVLIHCICTIRSRRGSADIIGRHISYLQHLAQQAQLQSAACAWRRYTQPSCRLLDNSVAPLPLFCQSFCLALIPVPLLSLLLVVLSLPGILKCQLLLPLLHSAGGLSWCIRNAALSQAYDTLLSLNVLADDSLRAKAAYSAV